jgi:hypothetical protein
LWLGSLCEQAPFKPIAQNFLLSISSRRIEAVSVTSSFLNSRAIGFKSRGLSFHISDLNGAKEGCQAARKKGIATIKNPQPTGRCANQHRCLG